VKFFFDNTLPPRLAKALDALVKEDGHTVTHLREKFATDTEDPVWISALAKEGEWIIISGDPRITKGRHEKAAWKESHLTACFLKSGWTNFRLWDQVWRLVKFWPAIVAATADARPGAGFLVNVNGKIETLE